MFLSQLRRVWTSKIVRARAPRSCQEQEYETEDSADHVACWPQYFLASSDRPSACAGPGRESEPDDAAADAAAAHSAAAAASGSPAAGGRSGAAAATAAAGALQYRRQWARPLLQQRRRPRHAAHAHLAKPGKALLVNL